MRLLSEKGELVCCAQDAGRTGMVKGIDIFREYTDQYVLIGGAACSVSFEEQEISFGRTTKDFDVVLIVEAQTREFVEEFDVTEAELKNLKIRGTKPTEIKEILRAIYLID